MPTAGITTVTTVGTQIFDVSHPNDRATVFGVGVTSTSSFGAMVNVAGLHADDDYYPVEPGQRVEFGNRTDGISKVTAKGNGGDAVIAFGIIERTAKGMRSV